MCVWKGGVVYIALGQGRACGDAAARAPPTPPPVRRLSIHPSRPVASQTTNKPSSQQAIHPGRHSLGGQLQLGGPDVTVGPGQLDGCRHHGTRHAAPATSVSRRGAPFEGVLGTGAGRPGQMLWVCGCGLEPGAQAGVGGTHGAGHMAAGGLCGRAVEMCSERRSGILLCVGGGWVATIRTGRTRQHLLQCPIPRGCAPM